MPNVLDHRAMLQVALAEARQGLGEGGVPIGAALYRHDGTLLGRGHDVVARGNRGGVSG